MIPRACATPDHVLDRHDGAERVRHLGDRDQLRAGREELLELLDQEIAVIVDRRPFDHGAMALLQEVPGHDVGMMLHDREHDLVALADVRLAVGGRHEVDRLGDVTGEDDLFAAAGVDELRHLGAGALIGLGRGVGEVVQAAMHIGVFGRVGLHDAVEHRSRLLRGRRVVEIDQRLAVDLHGQRREILAHPRPRRKRRLEPPGACSIAAPPASARPARPRIAQIVVTDLLDGLADEGLDQERLRFLLRQAARPQVEQQAVVERAGLSRRGRR